MVHTENSGGKRVSSNIQSIYASPSPLAAGDIIISNKEIFSVLTEVLQKTVSLMTVFQDTVTQLISLHHANKLAATIISIIF